VFKQMYIYYSSTTCFLKEILKKKRYEKKKNCSHEDTYTVFN